MKPHATTTALVGTFIVMLVLPLARANSAALHIAVAASFKPVFEQLAQRFTEQSEHQIIISGGSSGQLFAQIQYGANYDAFFSADAERPTALAAQNPALGASKNYAFGQLALYSAPAIACETWQQTLASAAANDIALPNPKLAPYGVAAEQVLTSVNKRRTGMALASNAAIALNWLHSGSVKHVLSAYSFASNLKTPISVCLLASHLYSPIEQHFIALNARPVTQQFASFIQSPEAQAVLRSNGYSVPIND